MTLVPGDGVHRSIVIAPCLFDVASPQAEGGSRTAHFRLVSKLNSSTWLLTPPSQLLGQSCPETWVLHVPKTWYRK